MTKAIKKTVVAILLLCTALAFACFAACNVTQSPENPTSPSQNEQTENGGSNNSDNSQKNDSTEHVCSFVLKKTEEKYLKSVATCKSKAVYFKSCLCGKASETETFESGLPKNHSYTDKVCTGCSITQTNESLEFTLNKEETEYSVTGIGACVDADLIIPETYNDKPVTSIGKAAFKSCDSLTSITIGDNVTSVEDNAFSGCGSLVSITIGVGVTNIENYAFEGCSSLVEIKYNATECSDLTSDNYVFANAGKDGTGIKLTIGKNVKKIPARLFCPYSSNSSYSPKITEVVFEESCICESIGIYAFDYCKSLMSVMIPNSITKIENYAFDDCYKLVEVINESGLEIKINDSYKNGKLGYYALNIKAEGLSDIVNVDDYLFYMSGNVNYLIGYVGNETNLILPENYNGQKYEIYKYAFYNCSSFEGITIPEGVSNIGDSVFYGCSSLKSIVIPNSVTDIGDAAFYNCGSLESVTISNSMENIGRSVFHGCISLERIMIPESVKSIEYDAFYGCSSIENICYNGDINDWVQIEGIDDLMYYGKSSKNLYINGELLTEANITTATKINAYAFYNCSSMTSVTIGNSVTSIGNYAFYNCGSLTSITMPNNITSIGNYAFYNCSSLTSITIPAGLSNIGDSVFYSCSSLTSVMIGIGVTRIDNQAFSDCSSLTSVYYEGTAEQWAKISIGSPNSNLTDSTIYYYSENEPTGEDNYWHYDESGNITVW